MNKMYKAARFCHKAILWCLAFFTVPALVIILLGGPDHTTTGIMQLITPVLSWFMLAWFLATAYFCGCLILSASFREAVLTKIAGFRERDEREEIVTAKASRSVFLVTLGCLILAGLIGMIRLNVFTYTKWEGDRVPPLIKVRQAQVRKGHIEKARFAIWPSIGMPSGNNSSHTVLRKEYEIGDTQYYYESGSLYGPEVSRVFFAFAAIQILLFHLFARRVGT